jgi:hypothetical protein
MIKCRQSVALTGESGGCYTRERSLLRGFQQQVAAALQQVIACRVSPKELSFFPRQMKRLGGLSL